MSAFNLPNTATGVFDPAADTSYSRRVAPSYRGGIGPATYNVDPMGLNMFPEVEGTYYDAQGGQTGVRYGPQGPFDPTGRPQYGGVKQALGESLDMIRDLALSGDERRACWWHGRSNNLGTTWGQLALTRGLSYFP